MSKDGSLVCENDGLGGRGVAGSRPHCSIAFASVSSGIFPFRCSMSFAVASGVEMFDCGYAVASGVEIVDCE